MKENKEMKCDPCERDFEHKVGELVKEGKTPTHEEREKREREIKAVFGEHHSIAHTEMQHSAGHTGMAAAAKPASKPTEKHPVGAGGAKMKK